MGALEYMTKQMEKHSANYERETENGAPDEVLKNIEAKIGYYCAAIEALRKEGAQCD